MHGPQHSNELNWCNTFLNASFSSKILNPFPSILTILILNYFIYLNYQKLIFRKTT
ncbi:hypothetical protein J588_0273 [Acinetobacter sp. 1578804]|nr:hypothetical protein J569_1929 [Acinetobacter sp. 907131]EXE93841.1 hypothetical protein J588_0273 [Acinetobacter sp. 1578804]EXS16419.1 hypothetical protein J672_1669 [Acinetobacter sp. 883425]EYT46548.1 hypothetical protein J619_01045 [Acinetobacter sp. 478810]KCX17252.1 hypothetical protein J723_0849 [Acinetobacter sp. 1264765]KCX97317.1 hypothetical protein J584_2092 [Acinetobacter sp. 72431]